VQIFSAETWTQLQAKVFLK